MIAILLKDTDSNILLVHPEDRQHRRYLADLLRDDYSFTYVCFSGEDIDFEEAQEAVFREFEMIGHMDSIPSAHIIDECDRLSDDALEALLPYLAELVENNEQFMVLLYARNLPDSLFNDERTMQVLHDTAFAHYNDKPSYPVVEASGFGAGRVRVDGKQIDFGESKLLHEMFFYALEHPVFFRDDIISDFWSETDKYSAITTFHTRRKALNTLLGFEYIRHIDNHYTLTTKMELHYDVYRYQDLLFQVMHQPSYSIATNYQAAIQIQHHAYLMNSDSGWIKTVRETFRSKQSDMCFELARLEQDEAVALGLYSQSFRLNPYREDSAGAMMHIYLQLNMPCDALFVYNVLADNLYTTYGILPGSPIQLLMQQAKANCP